MHVLGSLIIFKLMSVILFILSLAFTDMPALSVNLLSPTSLTISWTLEDNSVTATSYNISYSNIDTDCFTMTYEDITSSEMTVELTGLEEGTEYSITITAILNDVVVGRDDLMGTTMTASEFPVSFFSHVHLHLQFHLLLLTL